MAVTFGGRFVELAAVPSRSADGVFDRDASPLALLSQVLLEMPSAPVERKSLPVKCVRTVRARVVRALTPGTSHISDLSCVHPLT